MDPNVILAFLIWIPFAAMWARKRILLRRADSRALAEKMDRRRLATQRLPHAREILDSYLEMMVDAGHRVTHDDLTLSISHDAIGREVHVWEIVCPAGDRVAAVHIVYRRPGDPEPFATGPQAVPPCDATVVGGTRRDPSPRVGDVIDADDATTDDATTDDATTDDVAIDVAVPEAAPEAIPTSERELAAFDDWARRVVAGADNSSGESPDGVDGWADGQADGDKRPAPQLSVVVASTPDGQGHVAWLRRALLVDVASKAWSFDQSIDVGEQPAAVAYVTRNDGVVTITAQDGRSAAAAVFSLVTLVQAETDTIPVVRTIASACPCDECALITAPVAANGGHTELAAP